MPQEFHVLQCYSCDTFQVHIIKKIAKWSCKICSEKQSVKKVFARGTGQDCRSCVQELNERRIKCIENVKSKEYVCSLPSSEECCKENEIMTESKWVEFVQNDEDKRALQTNTETFSSDKNKSILNESALNNDRIHIHTGNGWDMKYTNKNARVLKEVCKDTEIEKSLGESSDQTQSDANNEKTDQHAEKKRKLSASTIINIFEPECNDLDLFLRI